MKIIKKTKKYLHIRLTEEEFDLLTGAVKEFEAKKKKEARTLEYATWFYTNHVDISWQDEYSSWHTDWINIQTKKSVSQGQIPDLMSGSIYKTRFLDVIKKNKKKLGYKD